MSYLKQLMQSFMWFIHTMSINICDNPAQQKQQKKINKVFQEKLLIENAMVK